MAFFIFLPKKIMKAKLLALVFLSLSLFFSAQNNDQKAVTKSFTDFLTQLKNKEIDRVVESIYPKFFTATPEFKKDQMKMILNMTYNNPIMKVGIEKFKVINVGSAELAEGEYFIPVNYSVRMYCNVEGMSDEMRKKIESMLFQKYGRQNVVYYPNDMIYYVNAPMKACAISKDRKNWKFVMIEKEFKPRLAKVLPKKVLDKI